MPQIPILLTHTQWNCRLDLLEYVFRIGLFTEEIITIPGTKYTMSITEIKAKAFEKVYPYLPIKHEIEFILDKFVHMKPVSIVELLAGMPTRTLAGFGQPRAEEVVQKGDSESIVKSIF